MALPEYKPGEKVKGGGWAPLLIIVAIVIGLLAVVKLLMG